MTKRIDQLTPGTQVVLGFVGWGNTLTTDNATFVGVTGAGDDRRATFRSANTHSPRGSYEWDAYRYNGGWVYGTSAQRLRLLEVRS